MENPRTILRFGDFELDVSAGELRKRGVRTKLQEQPLQVLTILLSRPRQVVTREELRRTLWPSDTFVDFDHSLASAVMRLREALGDSADSPRFVETLPKRGYRFLAPVSAEPATVVSDLALNHAQNKSAAVAPVAAPEPEKPQAARQLEQTGSRPRKHDRLIALSILIMFTIMLTAAAGLWLSVRRHGIASADEGVQSIAVLPIENLTGDKEQEYLADGVTDELTAGLAKIRSLRVISRTSAMSYKETRKSLPQIARELNVNAVVEGTLRRSGDRIRITAELIQASTDRHLWVETYDTDLADILPSSANVIRAIAKELHVKLTPGEQHEFATRTMNAAAYEAYLKGRYYWNKRTADGLERAISYFQESIRLDPNSALAYAGLADTYDVLASAIVEAVPKRDAYPKAKEAALKAVQLDDSLAEAHTSLATMNFNYDWNWPAAERELKRAIEIDPNYATAHQRYSLYLIAMGHLSESIAEMTRARDLDPMSVSINFSLGWRLYFARRYDEAIAQLRTTLELDPNCVLAHRVMGQTYAEKGEFGAAINELETAAKLSGNAPLVLGPVGYVYARAGKYAEAKSILKQMEAASQRAYVSPVHRAEVYVGLGDTASALQWLQRAYEERANDLVFLKVDPEFDGLRSNPQFSELLRRVGLP